MRAVVVIKLALTLAVAGGCAMGPKPSVDITQSPTTATPAAPTPEPTLTPAMTEEPASPPATDIVSTQPPPTAQPTDAPRELIDRFWSKYLSLACIKFIAWKEWHSLRAMTRDVDAVVMGRPVAVGTRYDGTYQMSFTFVRIELEETLKGEVIARPDGTIDLIQDGGPPGPSMTDAIPANVHVFFLRSFAAVIREQGGLVRKDGAYSYYLPTPYQNVFANVDGEIIIPTAQAIGEYFGRDAFPLELQGSDFDDVVDKIRRSASESANIRGLTRRNEPPAQDVVFAC